jgi:hypothetical protein
MDAAILTNERDHHPHSLLWFQNHRPEIHGFVARELSELVAAGKRHVLVSAPVKSGKREIVEAIAQGFPLNTTHYFVTSLDRKDVKLQGVELATYGIRTCVATKDDGSIRLDIQADIAAGRRVMLLIDESDYGSGARQKLAAVFKAFRDAPRVVFIYFSATAEETEASELTERADYAELEFTPPATYCGAKYFIDNDLVFDPEDFFSRDDENVMISRHGLDVIRDSITAERHIGVVRVTGRGLPQALLQNARVREGLRQQLGVGSNGRPWVITVITEKSAFAWESPVIQLGHTADVENNHLFLIFQTCTRGTDLKGWHHKLAFWHDARTCRDNSNLNTLVQAILRPSHYSTTRGYGGQPQPVRLYVDRIVVRYAAYGDLDSYVRAGGRPPTRTRKVRTVYEYDIQEKATFAEAAALCVAIEQEPPALASYQLVGGLFVVRGYGMTAELRAPHSWLVADARKAARAQYNRRQHYVLVPCYRDLADPDSLVWIATRKIGKQAHVGLPIVATSGSMYNIVSH